MANVVVTQLIVDASGAKLGVAEFTAAMDKAKRAAVEGGEATATSFERAQARWTASLAKTDPVIKAQIAMEKDLQRQREIGANAVKLGIATQDAATAQITKVTQQHQAYIATLGGAAVATEQMAAKTGLAGYELQNLWRQVQDVAVSLKGGQSFSTVLAQQGSQIQDVFANTKGTMAGFFGQIVEGASNVAGFITPVRLLAAGATALGVEALYAGHSWAESQKEIERALAGVGKQSGATAADVTRAAAVSASSTNTSFAAAQAGATELLKSGDVYKDNFNELTLVTSKFALATGTTTVEAAQKLSAAFSGDENAIMALNKQYGFLNASTLSQIRNYNQLGNAAGAQLTFLKSFEPVLDKLEDKGGAWSRTFNRIINTGSNINSFIGATVSGGSSDEERLGNARSRRQNVIDRPSMLGADDKQQLVEVVALNKEIAELEKRINSASAAAAAAQLDKLGLQVDAITRAIDPSIGKIEQLSQAYFQLQKAKEQGISSPESDAAARSAREQEAALIGASAEAERYGERVAEIAVKYGDVSTSTAQALQASENQRPVIEAIGGAAKMAAQYAADYANAMDKGKTATDATALAADRLKNSQAAAVAGVQQQTQALQQQNQLQQAGYVSSYDGARKISEVEQANRQLSAVNDQQRIASQQAYDKSIKDTGETQEGIAVARAKSDEVALSYQNQIAGATEKARDAQAAASAKALEWQQNMLGVSDAARQAAASAQQAADAFDAAQKSANAAGKGIGTFLPEQMPTGQHTFAAGGSAFYTNGGIGKDLSIQGFVLPPPLTAEEKVDKILGRGGNLSGALRSAETSGAAGMSLVDQITQVLNGQTTDKGTQAANLQSELGWLKGLPETIARDQKIISLQQSIDSLIKSTDSLNNTNQDLLSPYYSQDPRTSHIGFRSQGMATGGEFTVPGGYSANDNMIAQVPVASGEIVAVRRPGQNVNGATTQNVSVTNNITVPPAADMNAIGRTVFQATQSAARQLAASGQ